MGKTNTPPPAPTAAPAPAPAPSGDGQTTQSPVPAPAVNKDETAQQETSPELTGIPAQTSSAGVTLTPHVPAPIPPREAAPALPKEAQPAAQGSLTPAQTEDKRKRNPAIKEAPSPVPAAPAPAATDEGPKNEEGFIPGEEVNSDVVFATERARSERLRNERAAAQAKK